ncbi:MAG: dipeptide epimerase [Planctomycetota bacterium]
MNPPRGSVRTGVESLRAYHVRIPLKKKISHASHTRTDSDNVVVACRLTDGTVGYGEGVPRDYVTGETIQTSLELLRQCDWSILADPPSDFREAVERAGSFTMPSVAGDDRHCVGNAARCAVEMAYLDAFGRRFGQSLTLLAGELAECAPLFELQKRCRYSGAITSKRTLGREKLSAWKMWLGRFKHCKIKVGTEGQNDPERLRVFRGILGDRMDFRVDANEAWTPENVEQKIRELEPYGITAVEQPVPHEQVLCLRDVRRRIRTPIMHDESLCSWQDAEKAIADETCDLFNLRISKCGGLIPTLRLAALANENGLGYQLGCQIGETGILSAAGRAIACSIKGIRYLEGSYDHFLVRERLTKENLTFEWRGIADVLPGPGLGITVEPARLASVTIAEEVLFG